MASFLVFLPAILLSGFMFPVTSMPEVFQWVTLLNPVRHYIEIVRAVFLKGAGLDALSRSSRRSDHRNVGPRVRDEAVPEELMA